MLLGAVVAALVSRLWELQPPILIGVLVATTLPCRALARHAWASHSPRRAESPCSRSRAGQRTTSSRRQRFLGELRGRDRRRRRARRARVLVAALAPPSGRSPAARSSRSPAHEWAIISLAVRDRAGAIAPPARASRSCARSRGSGVSAAVLGRLRSGCASSSRPCARVSLRAVRGTPTGIRTQTEPILSRLPLPVGLPGRTLQPRGRAASTPRYALGREAKAWKYACGASRAASVTLSRPRSRFQTQPLNTRSLRSHIGIARPW